MLKGAKWVETNPKAAAALSVEKKYLASTPELNTVALARLRYIPTVRMAEESLHTAAREMKVAKMLSPETDTEALAKRAFMHLEGVTDDWIKSLEVETVAGGQVAPNEDIRLICGIDDERHGRFLLPKANVRSARPGGAESGRPGRAMSFENGARARMSALEELKPQVSVS